MNKKGGIEGEGSYSGTRDYNKRTAEFIKKGKVDKAAKDAERAMDSSEAADLKEAEQKGKQQPLAAELLLPFDRHAGRVPAAGGVGVDEHDVLAAGVAIRLEPRRQVVDLSPK